MSGIRRRDLPFRLPSHVNTFHHFSPLRDLRRTFDGLFLAPRRENSMSRGEGLLRKEIALKRIRAFVLLEERGAGAPDAADIGPSLQVASYSERMRMNDRADLKSVIVWLRVSMRVAAWARRSP